ncbi:MAG: hypothetical protein IIW87_08670 [Alistipes sp.]|nr:hypothetical protein [Alistipes sp.]
MVGSLVSCRQAEVEPMIAAGYIEAASSSENIIIKGDTIGVRHFAIDEQTEFEGGEVVEGNIAEVIYMPSSEPSELPLALTITTDTTYPKALGRWVTAPKAQLQIDLELKPRGRITQHQPQQTLHFTSWQLSGEDEQIVLHGIISLPPEIEKAEKRKKDEEPTLPQRRERKFKITARVTKQSDSNTESREVMIFRTEKGVESRLYLQE